MGAPIKNLTPNQPQAKESKPLCRGTRAFAPITSPALRLADGL